MVKRGRTCEYCGCRLTRNTARIDHIIPVSRGGLNLVRNMAICCQYCNSRKGERSIAEYLNDLHRAARALRKRFRVGIAVG